MNQPQQPQFKENAQYSLFQQLIELKTQANFSGLYDASDFIGQIIDNMVKDGVGSKPLGFK